MTPTVNPDTDPQNSGSEAVRFLAWVKKRGARVRYPYCRKKWERSGICAEDLVKKFGDDKIRVQRHPSSGERWVILLDLPWADNLMIEFDEEVPHHRQWIELGK